MTIYVFTGPTLGPKDRPDDLDMVYLPPVEQGHVYALAKRQPTAIGIIDGRYQDVPAVWHKEILWALGQGIPVYGSASMGALRAAELAAFGMRGVGWVFEAYRDGVIEDDDEVAIAHAGREDDFVPTSEAMVNIRRTLASAERDGHITAATRRRLTALVKETFFPSRSYGMLLELGRQAGLPGDELDALRGWLPNNRIDQKKADALRMLRVMRSDIEAGVKPEADFTFQHTVFFEQARLSAALATADDDRLGGNVTIEDLMGELRLDPPAYHRIRERATTRLLAGRTEDNEAAALSEEELACAADWFRNERDLRGESGFQRWLGANELTSHQFMSLVRQEIALQQFRASLGREVDTVTDNQLRADGLYPQLAERIRTKRSFLADRGLYDAASVRPGDISDAQLMRWYFERLGTGVPESVLEHARSLGFRDETRFLLAVRREYWFTTLNGAEDADADKTAAER
ncbi:TfuA-like protein [Wenjunlia tyrosinilytica]|jgi:hypothetical protein|uniref:TfuA-like core domain-containing protein n=1 Tax=Wenjunlia tyrosinilytica TaxID=1544741 RepID=A0A918E0Z0_9ACTN|nr:TfuA-like protein [Wenjunlia tyrosinilytica]GGP00019.1 hypothetical protein GCM10012280_67800 [Wenjunlia tyrosinilytica]